MRLGARTILTAALAGVAIALGCGVEALDLTGKTCPCDEGAGWRCVDGKCLLNPDAGEDACVGKTCADFGVGVCGGVDDGCGRFIACGDCPDKQHEQCVDNKCVCNPLTDCATVNATCGLVAVGCGSSSSLSCGTCTPPEVCGGGGDHTCGKQPCVPQTACLPTQCGDISDGCGGSLSCPACPCTPTKTCADYESLSPAECGALSNGCAGGTITCGCVDSNRRCLPSKKCCYTCESLGYQCGDGPDGCGGTIHCGACDSGTCNITTHKC